MPISHIPRCSRFVQTFVSALKLNLWWWWWALKCLLRLLRRATQLTFPCAAPGAYIKRPLALFFPKIRFLVPNFFSFFPGLHVFFWTGFCFFLCCFCCALSLRSYYVMVAAPKAQQWLAVKYNSQNPAEPKIKTQKTKTKLKGRKLGQETAAVKGRGYSTQQAYDTCLNCSDRVLTQLCPASGSSVENGLAQPSTLGYLVLDLAILTYLT